MAAGICAQTAMLERAEAGIHPKTAGTEARTWKGVCRGWARLLQGECVGGRSPLRPCDLPGGRQGRSQLVGMNGRLRIHAQHYAIRRKRVAPSARRTGWRGGASAAPSPADRAMMPVPEQEKTGLDAGPEAGEHHPRRASAAKSARDLPARSWVIPPLRYG